MLSQWGGRPACLFGAESEFSEPWNHVELLGTLRRGRGLLVRLGGLAGGRFCACLGPRAPSLLALCDHESGAERALRLELVMHSAAEAHTLHRGLAAARYGVHMVELQEPA